MILLKNGFTEEVDISFGSENELCYCLGIHIPPVQLLCGMFLQSPQGVCYSRGVT